MPVSQGLQDIHVAQTQRVRNGSRRVLIEIKRKGHPRPRVSASDAKKQPDGEAPCAFELLPLLWRLFRDPISRDGPHRKPKPHTLLPRSVGGGSRPIPPRSSHKRRAPESDES